MWPLRSMLFIPAHKLAWTRRVSRFAPDSVVLDLEDSVPLADKIPARSIAREAIGLLHGMGIPAFVRINSLDQGGLEDAMAVATTGYSGVMLPKGRTPDEVRELDVALSYAEGKAGLPLRSVAIMPLPETAEGLWAARDLAAASRRVKGIIGIVGGLVIGDVARAAGFRPTLEGSEQIYLASKMVLDSRAAGALYPMSSIIGAALEDHAQVRQLCARAKAIGFTGAVLIHPSHVAIANEVFTPNREEVEYYKGLVDAMREAEAAGSGAVTYRGQMIDYAMLPIAEEVLREARRRGMLPG